jgi:hypothetical protein
VARPPGPVGGAGKTLQLALLTYCIYIVVLRLECMSIERLVF